MNKLETIAYHQKEAKKIIEGFPPFAPLGTIHAKISDKGNLMFSIGHIHHSDIPAFIRWLKEICE